MGDVASAVVNFVLSIFEGLCGGMFKAAANTLSSVHVVILFSCISIAGLAAVVVLFVVGPDYLMHKCRFRRRP